MQFSPFSSSILFKSVPWVGCRRGQGQIPDSSDITRTRSRGYEGEEVNGRCPAVLWTGVVRVRGAPRRRGVGLACDGRKAGSHGGGTFAHVSWARSGLDCENAAWLYMHDASRKPRLALRTDVARDDGKSEAGPFWPTAGRGRLQA